MDWILLRGSDWSNCAFFLMTRPLLRLSEVPTGRSTNATRVARGTLWRLGVAEEEGFELNRGTSIGARLLARSRKMV
jgi:hypothetical protein